MDGAASKGDHPSDESLAALLDDRLGDAETLRLLRHLWRCRECLEIASGADRDRRRAWRERWGAIKRRIARWLDRRGAQR